jgi:hypothetical protein
MELLNRRARNDKENSIAFSQLVLLYKGTHPLC